MSGAHGMAALADSPCGPFFVTREMVAPVRAASVSAARVITVAALGLPLSSTAIRRPASDGGDGASVAVSGPGAESGRYTFISSPLHRDRRALRHSPRRHNQGVLAWAAG